MSHSSSCTACSDLEMFLDWTWTMCGCWSGWRQRKRKDRGGFLLFPFLSSCSSVWTMAYSKKQTGIFINLFICSFIHQIFSVLGSGAKTMCKVLKKKKSTRVIIRRVWLPLAFKLSIVKTINLLNIHQLFLDDLLPSRTCAKGRGYIKEQYGDNLCL